jgi:hypothetical protein
MTVEDRATTLRHVEAAAELLAIHQIDLIAQLEAQLRAVRHTMRSIERLRDAKHRIGAEPSNGQRDQILAVLASEVAAIDDALHTQHLTCADQQCVIREMQARMHGLKQQMTRAEP